MMSTFEIKSNSPLRKIPDDYLINDQSSHWFIIPEGHDKGKKMFYTDFNPEAKEGGVVLFVHGNPECSYTYRHVRDELMSRRPNQRIVAMDHIGFGISDRATHEMVEKHHAFNLSLLIRELDLTKIQLVIHDWGGPIGVGSLIDMPDRVGSLVVMNTTVFPMPKSGYTYANYPYPLLPWALTPKIIPNSLWGGVSGYVVSNAAPQGFLTFVSGVLSRIWKHATQSFDPKSPEQVWSQMLRDNMNARSSKRQVLQTPVWGHGYEYTDAKIGKVSNHDFYEHIQSTITARWQDRPITGFFGQWDPCGKNEVIEQWAQALPLIKNHLFTYPDVGHFIEEYKGAEIAAKMNEFLEDY